MDNKKEKELVLELDNVLNFINKQVKDIDNSVDYFINNHDFEKFVNNLSNIDIFNASDYNIFKEIDKNLDSEFIKEIKYLDLLNRELLLKKVI